MKKFSTVILIALSFLMISCGAKKDVWYTSLDEAKKEASKSKRGIFLLFTADDFDGGKSSKFKSAFTDNEKFKADYSRKFVFANIEFKNSDFIDMNDDSVKNLSDGEQKKLLDEKSASLKAKQDVARVYGLKDGKTPAMYILSSEGYVMHVMGFDEKLESYEDFAARISDADEKIGELSELISSIYKLQGMEKFNAIMTLVESTPSNCIEAIYPIVKEGIALDPNNESGKVGFLELTKAYIDSSDQSLNGGDGSAAFVEVISKGHLDAVQKQEAWYIAAYLLMMSKPQNGADYDKVLEYLNNGLNSSTDVYAKDIISAIDYVKTLKENVFSGKNSPAAK